MSEETALTIQRIMRQTTEARLPDMMRNVANNMHLILDGKCPSMLPKRPDTPVLVIGAGPSLEREKHLDLLAESNWKYPIISTDRTLVPLLERGIVPDLVGSVDGHPIISKFYDGELVDKYADRLKAVLPITIHPNTAKFKGEKYWYVPRMDDFDVDGWISLTKSLQHMVWKSVLVTGGCAGTFCWNLGLYLHCNPLILIGMDLSYDTTDYKQTIYYNALLNYYKGDEKQVEQAIQKGYNPIYRRHYLIDPVFQTYHAFMMNYINQVDVTTVNCTEGGSVFGGKVLCSNFREVLERYCPKKGEV
uniref:6-hydroxymethylpterin diphosphokinase MptE-like domain-containing protein n=1 Tax=viral metagenome TaxID=1070528 RepID=A0A6M3J4S2_9ZZZZ